MVDHLQRAVICRLVLCLSTARNICGPDPMFYLLETVFAPFWVF